jgi:hypothetical protein
MKIEEFAMKEIPKMNSHKRMKLNFYMSSQTPKRIGGGDEHTFHLHKPIHNSETYDETPPETAC